MAFHPLKSMWTISLFLILYFHLLCAVEVGNGGFSLSDHLDHGELEIALSKLKGQQALREQQMEANPPEDLAGPKNIIVILIDSTSAGKVPKIPSTELPWISTIVSQGMSFLTDSQGVDAQSKYDLNFNYPFFAEMQDKLEKKGYHVGIDNLLATNECGSTGDGSCLISGSTLSNETAETLAEEWNGFLSQELDSDEEPPFSHIFYLSSDLKIEYTDVLAMDWLTGMVISSLEQRQYNESTMIFLYTTDHFSITQFPKLKEQYRTYTKYSSVDDYRIPAVVWAPAGVARGVFTSHPLTPNSIAKTIYSLTATRPVGGINSNRIADVSQIVLDYEDIDVVEDFFTAEECDYFISQTFPPKDDAHKKQVLDVNSPERKWVYRASDDKVKLVSERISSVVDLPVENMEDLQVVYYKPTQQSLGRFEACVSETQHCIQHRERGGVRTITVFIYLNDDYTGGELDFPARGRNYKAKKGTALFVNNLDHKDGTHPGSFYRELPVLEGLKFISYIFIRQREFAYPAIPEPPPYVSTANMTEMRLAALSSKYGPIVNGTVGPCDALCTTNKTDGDYLVQYFDNFISDEEAAYLIELALPKMVRSSVMGEKRIMESRTSRNTFIGREDAVVKRISKRIARVVNMPVENQEAMQVVHYTKRQQYMPHFDACVSDHITCLNDRKKGGYRYVTMFLYLNDNFGGGGTGFPALHCTSKAKKKRGVVFYNLNIDNSTAHPFSTHSGEPVTEGEKFGANIWIRLGKFVNDF